MKELSISEVKDIELGILKFIDTICRENSITYSIDGGTLLGAIRHKGFIPWDDDIDIIMLRQQYNKFIKVIEENTEVYYLLSCNNNDSFFYPYVKVCDSRTTLDEIGVNKINKYGIYIDVFPIDNVPDKDILGCIYFYFIYLLKIIIWFKVSLVVPKSKLKKMGREIINIVLTPVSANSIAKILNKVSQIYNSKTTKFAANNVWGAISCKSIPVSVFYKHITVSFENLCVSSIKDYDYYLKVLYGKYMELPPMEDRISNHNFKAYLKD